MSIKKRTSSLEVSFEILGKWRKSVVYSANFRQGCIDSGSTYVPLWTNLCTHQMLSLHFSIF